MNKVILLGRLTRDPELKRTASGTDVANFTVAVNRPYSKDAQNRQADFIDCVAWRNTAEFVGKYFAKGKPILVEGRLQVRSYEDREGAKRRVYEVVCDNVNFVEGAAKSENRGHSGAPGTYSSGADEFREVELDGDMPF